MFDVFKVIFLEVGRTAELFCFCPLPLSYGAGIKQWLNNSRAPKRPYSTKNERMGRKRSDHHRCRWIRIRMGTIGVYAEGRSQHRGVLSSGSHTSAEKKEDSASEARGQHGRLT